MNETLDRLLLAAPGAVELEPRSDGKWMNAPALDVLTMAKLMVQHEARLSTMTAIALDNGETEVIYHYALGGSAWHIRVITRQNSLPSITPVTAAANWIEREIMDLYAVKFDGHPNPERLLRPSQLKPGYFREAGGAAGKALRSQG
jgi:NADH:ubiquinone oxidoreductase subunit C